MVITAVKNRRMPAVLILAAIETFLLLKYFITTRTAVSASEWLGSFGWDPVSAPFHFKIFLEITFLSAASLMTYLGWLALCWMVGTFILSRFAIEDADSSENALSALGLGLGLLSLIFFFYGLFHLYFPAIPYATAIVFLAAGTWSIRRGRSATALIRRKIEVSGLRWSTAIQNSETAALTIMGILCAATLLFHLLGAFLPPVSFDELNYQLAIPKLYALHHGFALTPYNHLSYLPRNMNMLFTLGLLEGSPTISKLFSWGMGVLAVLTVYVFGKPLIGKKASFLAAAIFFLTPVIGNQFRVAGTDLGVAAYELLGIFWLLRWLHPPHPYPLPKGERSNNFDPLLRGEGKSCSSLILSSVFWGLALGTKYSAIPGFIAGFLVLSWAFLFSQPRRANPADISKIITAWFAFLVPAILLWSPWLIQNWLDSGNPINPLLSTIIPSRNFYFAGVYKPMVDYAAGLGIHHYFPVSTLRDFLWLPWRILTEHNDFNHDLGPAWLLCVPLIFWPRRERIPAKLRPVAALCALYWIFWLASTVRMARYFVTGLALTSLLAGWLIESSLELTPWVLMIPLLIAMFQQSMRMIYVQNIYKKPWGYLAGRTPLKDYVESIQPNFSFDAFRFINRYTPPDAKILVFNEFRTFYLNRDFIASTPWDHDPWHEIVHTSASLEDISGKLRNAGITYFVVNEDYVLHQTGSRLLIDWSKEDWLKSIHFWKNNTNRLFYDDAGTWIAQVKERAAP